jgi:1-deoxy-D-xylulose-5-phosphate reductoisomerase
MRQLFLLGATGSIGTQVLDIVKAHRDEFELVSATANTNIDKLIDIIKTFHPKYVGVGSNEAKRRLTTLFPSIEVGVGDSGLIEAATYGKQTGLVVNAVVGSAGLLPTVRAIELNRDIALANKETLVIGGEIIMPLVKEKGVQLIPIDSEHSALMMCMKDAPKKAVQSLIITASGGSFRERSRQSLKGVTVKEALNHPNWQMGAKITIDSATMMNKGFEVIEAHHLFDMPFDDIQTVLHKESIVHALVEYTDGSMLAHLGHPDMRVPINAALFYPERVPYKAKRLALSEIGQLQFAPLSYERYPLLKYAIQAGKEGGIMPTVLNAANEASVALFLSGKITFLQIEEIVIECLNKFEPIKDLDIETILEVDQRIKRAVFDRYS